MRKLILLLALVLGCTVTGFKATGTNTGAMQPANGYPAFALGADVGWYSRIEDGNNASLTFYNGSSTSSGTTTQAEILDTYGLDAIRLRVWVNPDGSLVSGDWTVTIDGTSCDMVNTLGYCDKEDVLAVATELSAYGYRFLIDFHLSDTWTDPARQFVPAAWASCTTASALATKVSEHVTDVLTTLKENNINVQWVQIGNEIRTGFLKYDLPSATGATATAATASCGISSSSYANFVTVYQAGAKASKTVFPDAKLIFHSPDGINSSATSTSTKLGWTLSIIKASGLMSGTFTLNENTYNYIDLIGLSVYPLNSTDATADWQTNIDYVIANVSSIYSTYGKRTMICEFGMNNDYSTSGGTTQSTFITQCNTDVAACTKYLIDAVKDSYCDGLFYWEPFADHLDNYKMSAVYDIEGNWARAKVTPNTWWSTIKSYSSFPDGGLVAYGTSDDEGDEGDDPGEAASNLYIVYNESWDLTNPTAMTYDANTGLYTYTISEATYEGYENTWYFGISTAVSTAAGEDEDGYDAGNGEFEAASFITGATLVNGQYAALSEGSAAASTIKLPYAATDWKITVDLTNNRICAYTTEADPNAPSEGTVDGSANFSTISIYSVPDDATYAMSTTDGNSYYYSGNAGKSGTNTWFSFKIVEGNWENAWGNTGCETNGTEYTLEKNPSNGYSCWLGNWTTSASTYWWFNLETGGFKLTTSSTSPWTLKEVESVTYTRYAVEYDNSSTKWDEVYVYALDAEGNAVCGVWPGMRLTDPADAESNWTWSIITSGAAPATVSFSDGLSVLTATADEAYELDHVYAGVGLPDIMVYVAGDVTVNGQATSWIPNPTTAMVYNFDTGVYTADIVFLGEPYLGLSTSVGADAEDWDGWNANDIGCRDAIQSAVAQQVIELVDQASLLFAEGGTWHIELSLEEAWISAVQTAKPATGGGDAETTYLYVKANINPLAQPILATSGASTAVDGTGITGEFKILGVNDSGYFTSTSMATYKSTNTYHIWYTSAGLADTNYQLKEKTAGNAYSYKGVCVRRYENSTGQGEVYYPSAAITAGADPVTCTKSSSYASSDCKTTAANYYASNYYWWFYYDSTTSTYKFAITEDSTCPFDTTEYLQMSSNDDDIYSMTGSYVVADSESPVTFQVTDKSEFYAGSAVDYTTAGTMATLATTDAVDASLKLTVEESNYWWFRKSSGQFIINDSAETPAAWVPVEYTVHFDNSGTGWHELYAYAYRTENEAAVELLGSWPGTPMVYNDETDLWDLTWSSESVPETIIFCCYDLLDNETHAQTGNLEFENGKTYSAENVDFQDFYFASAANDWSLDDSVKFSTADGVTYFLTGVTINSDDADMSFQIAANDWLKSWGLAEGSVAVPGTTTLTAGAGNTYPAAELKAQYALVWLPATGELTVSYAHLAGLNNGTWELSDDILMQATGLDTYEATGFYGAKDKAEYVFVCNGDWDAKYYGDSNGLGHGVNTTLVAGTSEDDTTGWLASDIWEHHTVTFNAAEGTATVTGPRVLYLACDANNWLDEAPAAAAPRRAVASNLSDDAFDSYRFDYDPEEETYSLTGISLPAGEYVVADKNWEEAYTTEEGSLGQDDNYLTTYNDGDPHMTISTALKNANLTLTTGEMPKLTVEGDIDTGVENVTVDYDSEARYYDLTGIRVDNPQAGRFYIQVKNGSAAKVYLR